jgi:hypothetical protein
MRLQTVPTTHVEHGSGHPFSYHPYTDTLYLGGSGAFHHELPGNFGNTLQGRVEPDHIVFYHSDMLDDPQLPEEVREWNPKLKNQVMNHLKGEELTSHPGLYNPLRMTNPMMGSSIPNWQTSPPLSEEEFHFGNWEDVPFDERRQEAPRAADSPPKRADNGHLVFYHGTSPEGAKGILHNRHIFPDDINKVGLATSPGQAQVFGNMKKGPVLKVHVDPEDLKGLRVTHEIGGSGHSQFLFGADPFKQWGGVPVSHVEEIEAGGPHWKIGGTDPVKISEGRQEWDDTEDARQMREYDPDTYEDLKTNWAWRRPFLYDELTNHAYVGRPGMHHGDLEEEFGLGSFNEEGWAELPTGFIKAGEMPPGVASWHKPGDVGFYDPNPNVYPHVIDALNREYITGDTPGGLTTVTPAETYHFGSELPQVIEVPTQRKDWGQGLSRTRRPFIHSLQDGNIYLGQPGGHHYEVYDLAGHTRGNGSVGDATAIEGTVYDGNDIGYFWNQRGGEKEPLIDQGKEALQKHLGIEDPETQWNFGPANLAMEPIDQSGTQDFHPGIQSSTEAPTFIESGGWGGLGPTFWDRRPVVYHPPTNTVWVGPHGGAHDQLADETGHPKHELQYSAIYHTMKEDDEDREEPPASGEPWSVGGFSDLADDLAYRSKLPYEQLTPNEGVLRHIEDWAGIPREDYRFGPTK